MMYPDHACLNGSVDIAAEIVDHHALLRLYAESLRGHPVYLRIGFRYSQVSGQHDRVEDITQSRIGETVGIRHQPGPQPGSPRVPGQRQHRLTATVGTWIVDHSGVVEQ